MARSHSHPLHPWPPLRLWHLLSLDAPTVAALWCWALARAAGLRLPFLAPLMLAMGTWLLYVADRLLDGLLAASPNTLRERHCFHLEHRRGFLLTGIAVTAILAYLVVTQMPQDVLRENLALGACAVIYLLIVHLPPARRSSPPRLAWSFPKELAVGIVFAAATAVPAWSRLGDTVVWTAARVQLVPEIVLFALLCTLNCVAIETWEDTWEYSQGDTHSLQSRPHAATRSLGRHLLSTALIIDGFAASLLLSGGTRMSQPQAALVALIIAGMLSAFCFPVLDSLRPRISPLALRIAADAALLTPLLFLPWLRG